jgi:hypothetical protein
MEEVRYPYHSPRRGLVLDALDLAKWSMRKVLGVNRQNPRLPDILKRRVLARYARRYKLRTFVESGTYLGGTVAFMRKYCGQLYSVEYQPHLAKAAQERFVGDPAIHIFHGDGSHWIPRIVPELRESALFWLDGHFAAGTARSGEVACPTLAEISVALADTRYPHVLLIDDASEFQGDGGYPTIDALQESIRSIRTDVAVEVRNNIVRVTHKQAKKLHEQASES